MIDQLAHMITVATFTKVSDLGVQGELQDLLLIMSARWQG